MQFRYLNAAGAVCCEADTVAGLCDTCRAKAKAENLSSVVVTRSATIRTAPAAPAVAADDQIPPPAADAVARVLAASRHQPSRAELLSRIPRPEAVE